MYDFLYELIRISHFAEPVLYADIINATHTCGWAEAFERTCFKYNMNYVFTRYEKLAWYDSDSLDEELGKLFVEYELVEV